MNKASIVRRYPRRPAALARQPFYSDVDQLFNSFLGANSLFGRSVGEGLRDAWVPAVDVQETDKSFIFTAELPGMGKDDIGITLEDNLLTLSGSRELDEKAEDETYHRIERAYGKFSRSFTLPSQVDNTQVEASFKEGLLSIEVPKSEQAQPRKIEIK
jgi:HSP20 family protein